MLDYSFNPERKLNVLLLQKYPPLMNRLITHHYIMQLNVNIRTSSGPVSKHGVTQNWFPVDTTPRWHKNSPVDFAINVAERIQSGAAAHLSPTANGERTPHRTRTAIIIERRRRNDELWVIKRRARPPFRERLVSSLYLWRLYEY